MSAIDQQSVKVSMRAEQCPPSPIRKLVPLADAAKRSGKKVYHLNIGQPDIPTPPEFWDAVKNYKEEVLAYGPSNGINTYRKELVHYYAKFGIEVNESHILITTGGSEAIIFAFLATMDYGDEVIIPEPFYTNYNGFAVMAGVTVAPVTTYAENGFHLPDISAFQSRITPRTKAIMICNPGNPTGVVFNKEEMDMLIELCKKHNLFLIADEVYREFVFDGLKHISALSYKGVDDRVIMVDSISKRFSACGARIGCIISRNKSVMDAVLRFGQARLCAPTLEQVGATAALHLPQQYIDSVIGEYRCRRDVVYDALKAMPGVVCQKPSGAFYCIAKLPIENAEQFIVWLLNSYAVENETVMVAPADGFYGTPGLGLDEIRIAYVLNCAELKKAMAIFASGLKEFKRLNP